MKRFPLKPKNSAITSAVRQALLTSADTSVQPCGLAVSSPQPECCKTAKVAQVPDFDILPDSGFVRLPSLQLLFACSRATIWRWVKAKKIPAPKKLGPRISAWNVREIREVISYCMKGGK